MTDFTNASSWSLYQNVTVPMGNSITVSWHDRYQLDHVSFCPGGTCQPKRYFVEIVDPGTGAVLETLYNWNTIGNVFQDTGWLAHTVLTTQFYGGQTIRLRFRGTETIALTGPGQIEIDNVRVNALAPTAANVSVGGRILTSDGIGIANVSVSLTDAGGNTRSARSNSFGYYQFQGIPAGQTVVISVRAKTYNFTQPTQVFFVQDNLDDANFVAYAGELLRE